ncbi:hypothetical protein DYU11_02845 [Fibrisoma montanum]|uniref:CopG family transcriptional regulator n=1 Tax=Fibrisoma montanum TaxID=2305895 RepID=A0A418MIP2_9BACT|nr:hypothetical protein [Fibrisoma montanum]RIV27266.1 hypothetical protein DYU11_02845 [Fibrisoma montanum]
MTVLTIALDDALANKLQQETALTNADEAVVAQKVLTDYLRRQQMERLRQEVRSYTEAAGFQSEEDIFCEIS